MSDGVSVDVKGLLADLSGWMLNIEARLNSIEELMGDFETHVDDENDLDRDVEDMKIRLDDLEDEDGVHDQIVDSRLKVIEAEVGELKEIEHDNKEIDYVQINDALDLVRGLAACVKLLENKKKKVLLIENK
jgi:hypothetical protein